MAFNSRTHFNVRNLTRDPITLRAADGSFVMVHPGKEWAIEHKFNWDMPHFTKLSTTNIPHPAKSVMTVDVSGATTKVGHSTNLEGQMGDGVLTPREYVQATMDKIAFNRQNKVRARISNKKGTTYVGSTKNPRSKDLAKQKGLEIGGLTESTVIELAKKSAAPAAPSVAPVTKSPMIHNPALAQKLAPTNQVQA